MLKSSPNLQNANIWRGQRIGLLGGSFNPPHEGHLYISQVALRMLGLDALWWLVSPGNPLKDAKEYAPLSARLSACEGMLANEPHMLATDIEQTLGTTRSFDTLTALRSHFTATDFVFLMGSDSAQNFHLWHRWQEIPPLVALGVLERPPAEDLSRNTPLRLSPLAHKTLSRAENVPLTPGTCYWMTGYPLHPQSSTAIRNGK